MRHLARTLAGLVLILAIGVGAALNWRTQLAEFAGRRWLAAQGFAHAALTVKTLGLSRAVIVDLDLGPNAPQAERIAAAYSPKQLLRGEVKSLKISGLKASVTPAAEQPLPWLAPAAPSADGSGASFKAGTWLAGLPPIAVQGARIAVQLPGVADIPVHLNGKLHRKDGLTAAFAAHATNRFAKMEIHGRLTALAGAPTGRFDARMTADLTDLPAAWRNAVPLRHGRLSIELRHTGALPPLAAMTAPLTSIPEMGRLAISATLRDAGMAPDIGGLDATARFRLHSAAGELRVTAPKPTILHSRGASRAALMQAGVPESLARLLTGETRLELRSRRADQPVLRLRPADSGWRLDAAAAASMSIGASGTVSADLAGHATFDAAFGMRRAEAERLALTAAELTFPFASVSTAAYRGTAAMTAGTFTAKGTLSTTASSIRVAGTSVRDARVKAPVSARFAAMDDAEIVLRAPGWLRVGRITAPAGTPIVVPDRIPVSDAALTLRNDGIRVTAVARPRTVRIAETVRVEGGELALSAETGGRGLRLEATASAVAAAFPGAELAADGISGTIQLRPGGPPRGELSVASLRHAAETPAFKPLTITARATASGETYRLDGEVGLANAALRLPVTGRFDPATGEGRVHVPATTIRFAPDGLQPAALSPLLADVESAAGTLTPSATFKWGPDGLVSSGEVRIESLDATLPFCTLSGLDGTVALASLTPPRTAGLQTLTADTVTAALPLSDVKVRVRVDAGANGKPTVHVADATGELAGGTVSLRDVLWMPGTTRVDAPVHIGGMSLSKLIEAIGIEQVSGTGNLVGTIPVRVADGAILIDDGRLRATGSGRLRVRLGVAESLKAAGGRHVSMMLRALENFHYDTLSIRVNRPEPGGMTAAITLAGRNPEVFDGYPFRFNINVSGDMRPLLAALRRGRSLSATLLQDAISLQ